MPYTPPRDDVSTAGKALKLDALLVYVQATSTGFLLSRDVQLGLYFLAQHAVDAGFQVRVDNLSANDHVAQRLSRLVEEHDCPVLGFYVDQDNVWDLRRIFPALKELQPGASIVVGGPQVTGEPALVMERLPQALVGVVGEGEETFVELLSLPSLSTEHLQTCKGLVIRSANGAVCTPPRPLIEPLDVISLPRRAELNLEPKSRISTGMITGRGCHGRCAFCYEGRKHPSGKKLRLHSAERCLEEFDYLVSTKGAKYITVLDDSFVAYPRRLRTFCRGLVERYGGEKKWFCEARVDTLTHHPDLLPLMIEAGLIRVQVGGESGDQRILNAYRKGTTLEQMVAVVESAREHGLLSLYANFIVGGAFETSETYERTRDFAVKLLHLGPGVVALGKSYYTPYPGTPMYDDPEAYGLIVLDKEGVTGMGDRHVFCRTKELSRFEILEMGFEFERTVRETMTSLAREMSPEAMERHFRAHYDWGIATEWFDLLQDDPLIYSYFQSILRADAKSYSDASSQDFKDMYPTRHIDLVASRDECYLIRTPLGGTQQLDALDSRLLELSIGKLSLDDIVEIVREQTAGLDSEAVRGSLLERYERYDRDMLVVWRTNIV